VLVEARIDPRSIDLYGLENRRVGRLALTDDTYQRFTRDTIPCAAHVPDTGASKYAKVVVYDLLSGRVGAMTAKVK
jgi:hypothetical protein